MDELIAQLEKRYGNKHDFSGITQLQAELLLDSKVRNAKGGNNYVLVHINGIEPNGGLVSIIDSYGFWGRNRESLFTHQITRKAVYTELTQDPNPKQISRWTEEFTLPDTSKVRVQYQIYKDE